MSTLKTNNAQIGQSATATNNFTLYQPASPDGTVRLGVGNSGATTSDVVTVTNAGNATLLGNLTVSGAGTSTFAGTLNATTALQSGGVAAERIVQGTAQTTSGAAAYGYTGIPSWVKRITLEFNNTNASSANGFIQLGSGSYTTSGYSTNTNAVYNTGSIGATYTTGFSMGSYGWGTFAQTGAVVFSLLNSTTNLWVAQGALAGSSGGGYYTYQIAGSVALSGTLDRIQITTASGTFNAGSINIIYEG